VLCAALWPDPVDVTQSDVDAARRVGKDIQLNECPPSFRKIARKLMLEWTTLERQKLLSPESQARFNNARRQPKRFEDDSELRQALLDFIADFSQWNNSGASVKRVGSKGRAGVELEASEVEVDGVLESLLIPETASSAFDLLDL